MRTYLGLLIRARERRYGDELIEEMVFGRSAVAPLNQLRPLPLGGETDAFACPSQSLRVIAP
jgi:hypothetical protein